MNVFIVIPAYNEESRIFNVVESIRAYYKDQFTIVVVDDASTDATALEAQRAGAAVIHHCINRDQGAALVTGTQYALRCNADVIVHVDADGQHAIENIERLLAPIIKKEADAVLGSRFLAGHERGTINGLYKKNIIAFFYTIMRTLFTQRSFPIMRRILLYGNLIVNTVLTRVRLTDAHNGLRALSRHAAKKIIITQRGKAHATEYTQELKRNNLIYIEVPVTVFYLKDNKKSQGFFHGIRILRELLLGKFVR